MNDFKPFLVNDRSSALVNFIDASQFSESELVDVYLGLCDRLRHLIKLNPTIGFQIPDKPFTIEEPEIKPPTPESLRAGYDAYVKECQSQDEILFKILPFEASMMIGVIQSAVINVNLPHHIEQFCREFIKAFCDRHRENFPAICEAIILGWNPEYQKTLEDFDDLIGEQYQTEFHDDDELTDSDNQPFNGDGYDRYIEDLITDHCDNPNNFEDDFP